MRKYCDFCKNKSVWGGCCERNCYDGSRFERKAMSPEKLALKMIKMRNSTNDIEGLHGDMDDLFCEVLRDLGYGDAVKVFEDTEKWYS